MRNFEKAISLSPMNCKAELLKKQIFDLDRYRGNDFSHLLVKKFQERDSIMDKLRKDDVYSTQKQFDADIARLSLQRNIISMIGACLVLLCLVVLIVVYRKYNYSKSQRKLVEKQLLLETYQRQLAEYQSDIANAEQSSDEQLRSIRELTRKIKTLKSEQTETYAVGKQLYDSVVAGKSIVTWRKSDFDKFNEYYQIVDMNLINEINHQYQHLTSKQYFLAVLLGSGVPDDDIKKIMALGDSSFRSAKTRLNAKKVGRN